MKRKCKGSFLVGFGLGLLLLACFLLHHPIYNPDRCTTNCIGTTIAFDLSARGIKSASLSFDPEIFEVSIIKTIYPDAVEYTTNANYKQIKDWLYQEGGERGYLYYSRKNGPGHVVAYERVNNIIWIVDAQISRFRVPLWLLYIWDKGVTYRMARLDNIEFMECDLLRKIIKSR